MDLGLGMLTPPAGQARRAGPRGQAAVVEPVMLLKMEQRMEELYTQGDDRWRALLAAWMLYGGILRHKHLTRAEVRKVTMSTVHAHCIKGKQRRLRKGFDFCVPGQLSTGWDWSAAWLHDFALVPEKQKADCGLAFRRERIPWSLSDVYRMVRHEFADLVEDPAMVSSYPFRRVGTTVGQLVGFSALDMAALGDWQTKGDVPEDARMLLHYSGAKYAASLLAKHRMVGAVAALTHHESWELVPPAEVQEAAQAGQAASAQAKARDAQVVWAAPPRPKELQKRFALTQKLKRIAKAKAEAAKPATTMPASLNGRRLTAVMRDGKRLCPAFQAGQCPERVCGFAHLCACVRLTGRACGGKHAAGVCRVTKVVMVEDPEASIPARPSGAASSGSTSAEAMMLSPKIKAVPQKRPPEPSGPGEKRRRRDAWPEGDSEASSQPSRPAAVLCCAPCGPGGPAV